LYGLLLAVISAVLFGAATPASKALLGSLEPFQLAGLLYAGAALGMLPLVAREQRRGSRMLLDRPNAARLAGAVFFGGMLGPVLLLAALHRALAGSVALMLRTRTRTGRTCTTATSTESEGIPWNSEGDSHARSENESHQVDAA
jgi:drug/metabolite transporter (DMT)-like permease